MCDFELNKSNGWYNKLLQSNNQINPCFKTDDFSTEHNLRNFSKYFVKESSKLNRSKMVLNGDKTYFSLMSSSRNFHRRQNSDPLPSKFLTNDSSSFSPTSPTHKIYKQCGCEYVHESSNREFLLQEIKSLKEMNCKLWEHLCCVQAVLEKFMNKSCKHSNAISFSDLLLSLHNSLRAKDTAMENRMKLILSERDDAIQNLDNIVEIITRNFEDLSSKEENISSSEKEIKVLLKEIDATSNPAKLIQLQKLLLSNLYRSKELKLDCTLHEMQIMIIERDKLQLKVRLLENELHQLQKSNDICEYDKRCFESNLLNILCQTIQQRDTVLKNNTVKSEYSKSSVYGRLAEVNASSEKSNNACIMSKMLLSYENNLEKSKFISNKTNIEELKCLEEVLILNESFEGELGRSESTEKKCFRLNKLVKILQKKLDGKNIGILV